MVTSTIMKDTGGGTDAIFRPNAIRALCRIIDVSGEVVSWELELTTNRHRLSKVLSV